MSGRRRFTGRWLAAGVAAAAATIGRAADAPEPCCFTNERYAGVCRVVPEPEQTCVDILAYLNTPNSTGKTYCGATAIRGGWKAAQCAEPTAGPSGKTSGGSAALAPPRGSDRRPLPGAR